MKKIFGPDSGLFRFLQMLMNLAVMNILFLLTSIPIVTTGAAYTALLSCVFDLLLEEGKFSARFFLKKFGEVWKPASLIGAASLIVLAVLGHHAALFFFSDSSVRLLGAGLYIAFFIWVFGLMMYQFAMLARGRAWKKEMLRDGALLALAKFPVYIAVLLLTASPLTIAMMPASSLISMLPIVLLFWVSCPAMAGGWMMRRFLEKIYPELFRKKDLEEQKL
mgnify:CR=1 FL=1